LVVIVQVEVLVAVSFDQVDHETLKAVLERIHFSHAMYAIHGKIEFPCIFKLARPTNFISKEKKVMLGNQLGFDLVQRLDNGVLAWYFCQISLRGGFGSQEQGANPVSFEYFLGEVSSFLEVGGAIKSTIKWHLFPSFFSL